MRKLCLIGLLLFFLSYAMPLVAQTTISGNVSAVGKLLSDVNIDVYEYTSGIATATTNQSGYFSVKLLPEKIYLFIFYKSGYELKSFIVYKTNQNNLIPLNVELNADSHSPDGLLFDFPDIIINAQSGAASAFSPEKITPQSQSDSTMVIINRAITNQYLLVTKLKLNSNSTASRTVLQQKIKQLSDEISQHISNEQNYIAEEENWVKKSKTTNGEKQLDIITNAQLALANRLGEIVKTKMALQEKYLTEAAITAIECDKIRSLIKQNTNKATSDSLEALFYECSSSVLRQKNNAVRMNKEFETINKAFAHNYQEYIELLRYKNKQTDKKIDSLYTLVKKNEERLNEQNSATSLLQQIETKADSFSATVIREALAEDSRFANFREDSTVVAYDKDFNRSNRKIIGNDTYDVLVNKKLQFRYLKNNKPITKITYEFETKRKYKEVMLHIRNVSKF